MLETPDPPLPGFNVQQRGCRPDREPPPAGSSRTCIGPGEIKPRTVCTVEPDPGRGRSPTPFFCGDARPFDHHQAPGSEPVQFNSQILHALCLKIKSDGKSKSIYKRDIIFSRQVEHPNRIGDPDIPLCH